MSKQAPKLDKSKIKVTSELLSTRLKYHKFEYGDHKEDLAELISKNVCILPFETGEQHDIANVYMRKKHCFIHNKMMPTAVIEEYDDEQDDSNFDTVTRFMNSQMNVPISGDHLDKMYYLGQIEQSDIFHGAIACYAVDVTGMIKKKDSIIVIDELSQIVRRDYHDVIKNGSVNGMLASAVFMLIAHFA